MNQKTLMTDQDQQYDAISKWLTGVDEAETWKEWGNAYLEVAKSLLQHFNQQQAPVTGYLIGIVLIVFSLQSALFLYMTGSSTAGIIAILSQKGALRGVSAHIFLEFPWIAWPLAEFMHKGIAHLFGNIALLAILGKIVEPRFKRRYYILWFVAIAIIVKPIDAYISLSTSPKSNVAVYGISDFVYSLAVFSVFTLLNTDYRNELEYVALLVGGLAILLVNLNIVLAVIDASIDPVNPAHLLGGIIGGVVFGIVRFRQ